MKRIFQVMALVLATVVCFAACRSEEETAVSSSADLIELTQNQNYATFQIKSNTAWTLKCYAVENDQLVDDADKVWFTVTPTSGLGSHIAKLNVLGYNEDVNTRYGAIVVTSDDGKTQTIRVAQAAAASVECYVTPEVIEIPATGATDVVFTVVATSQKTNVEVRPDDVASMFKDNSIKDLIPEVRGNTLRKPFSFSVRANTTGLDRTSYIIIPVEFGAYKDTLKLTVNQAGSFSASIQTQSAVYMPGNKTTMRQALWVEGAKAGTTPVYSAPEIPSSVDWFTATISDGYLSVKTLSNYNFDSIRESYITIKAIVGSENVATTVRVVQAGNSAKSVLLASPYATFDYANQTGFAPYTLKNVLASALNAFSGYSWIRNIKVTNTGVYFDLDEFNGATERYREGSIFITVNNYVAQIKIRQYDKTAIGRINIPTTVTLPNGVSSIDIPYSVDGSLAVVAVSNSDFGATINNAENKLELSASADGNGVITLAYTHAGAVIYFNVVVNAYKSTFTNPFSSIDKMVYNFNRHATSENITLSQTGVTVVSSPSWANATVSGTTLNIDVAELTTSNPRTGLIILSYNNVEYVITVNQTYTD